MEHVLGIDHKVVEYALKARQHIIEQHGGVGQYDTLGRRVADIAFMP